jgi:hypothetical protein
MREACSLVWLALVGLFRSQAWLEAEILILRHQLKIQITEAAEFQHFGSVDICWAVSFGAKYSKGSGDFKA